MKNIILLALISLFSCKQIKTNADITTTDIAAIETSNKIKVLNVATFHFGFTPDANSVEFDENNAKIQAEVKAFSKLLAAFKPTIVCLEFSPDYDAEINKGYQAFVDSPTVLNTNYGEISMVGFDVARLNNLSKVYGIDYQMGYNYNIGEEITNTIDSVTYRNFMNDPFKDQPDIKALHENFENLPLIEKLQFYNNQAYLDYNININADILLHVGTNKGYEGADEATKFYQRNLRMYSNLNRIPMQKTDRVLILSGAAHAAFLAENLKRSPKFDLVNTLDYLK